MAIICPLCTKGTLRLFQTWETSHELFESPDEQGKLRPAIGRISKELQDEYIECSNCNKQNDFDTPELTAIYNNIL